jgi:hypothetical protein
MKSKLLILSLIVVLLFSALNVALASVECPRCHCTGRITTSQTCPTVGGSGVLKPTITRKSISSWGSTPPVQATFIAGVFHN